MKYKKCLISLGDINKYIIFALIGGFCKCFVGIMLYIFKDYANYNKHPLIIGFNSGLGMSFSLIAVIYVKLNSRRATNNNKAKLIYALSGKGTKNTNSFAEVNYMGKFNKSKLRRQKYLILLACAFLDFSQKFLTFFLNNYIINNLWVFNIAFINMFEYLFFKRKLYKHQYISSLVIMILGIAATIIGLYEEESDIFIKLFLSVFIEIMFSLAIVLSKYLMDFKSCTPFEITFYEGIVALIINSILLAIFTNIPLDNDNNKYDDILILTYYEGNKYIDNFYAAFNNMRVGEIFLFILSALGRLISNLFGHIIVKHYTSSHIILIIVLGEIALVFKESTNWQNITQFILFCFVLLMLLVFTEIIEINACDLEKNTRKNIQLREENEFDGEVYKDILNEEFDFDNEKVELNDDFEIELKGEKNSTTAK